MIASRPGRGRTVAVLGGTGFFGSRVVKDVLARTEASVIVASRCPRPVVRSSRLTALSCDLNDRSALRRLAERSDVLVHCAGPFRGQDEAVVVAVLEAGSSYVDISEDLALARRIRRLHGAARQRGVAVLTGASVVPGMEAVVAAELARRFDRVETFRAFAAPDLHHIRGRAMYRTMLEMAGHPAPLRRNASWRQIRGWSEPEWVPFPPPVGRRLVYLVPGMADQDAVPPLGYPSVEFKAGSEHPSLNLLLGLAGALHGRVPLLPLDRMTWLVRALSRLPGGRTEPGGAAMFEATGVVSGRRAAERIAIVAERDGGRIPAVLAGLAVEEILNGSLEITGAPTAQEWCSWKRLLRGLTDRGLTTLGQGGDCVSSAQIRGSSQLAARRADIREGIADS